ncbi:Microtubule-associated protein 70-4 [Platanthera guangdongensis]|uniref:Microtubule-associated protein 70-4 n=1 Tax=Platanthera guangdongensis TaxID=2320717 RepID=A0ABR2MDP7_9ASPA
MDIPKEVKEVVPTDCLEEEKPGAIDWGKTSRRRQGKTEDMGSLGEAGVRDFGNPVLIELNRLENLLKEKERELGVAQNEIKALKGTEFLKDKTIVEVNVENKLCF